MMNRPATDRHNGIYVIYEHLRDEMLQAANKMIKDGVLKRHRNNEGRLADGYFGPYFSLTVTAWSERAS